MQRMKCHRKCKFSVEHFPHDSHDPWCRVQISVSVGLTKLRQKCTKRFPNIRPIELLRPIVVQLKVRGQGHGVNVSHAQKMHEMLHSTHTHSLSTLCSSLAPCLQLSYLLDYDCCFNPNHANNRSIRWLHNSVYVRWWPHTPSFMCIL